MDDKTKRHDILVGFLNYLKAVADKTNLTYKDSALAYPNVDSTEGPRYWKVIVTTWGSRSVHSFVDRTTGDILKPASWSGPAKHARGNVLSPDHGASALSNYGVNYLR